MAASVAQVTVLAVGLGAVEKLLAVALSPSTIELTMDPSPCSSQDRFPKSTPKHSSFDGADALARARCISATPMRAPIAGDTQLHPRCKAPWRLLTQGARRVLVPLDQIYDLPEPFFGQRLRQLLLYARGRTAMGFVLVTKIACVIDKAIACARLQRARHRTVAGRGRQGAACAAPWWRYRIIYTA